MLLFWCFFFGYFNFFAFWFDGEKLQIVVGESYVCKLIYLCEGGNVIIFDGKNNVVDYVDGDYVDELMIYQVF